MKNGPCLDLFDQRTFLSLQFLFAESSVFQLQTLGFRLASLQLIRQGQQSTLDIANI